MNTLEELLEIIHPSRTYDVYRRKVDNALLNFPFQSFQINSWGSCDYFVPSFFAKINTVFLPAEAESNLELGLITFHNVYRPVYGEQPEKPIYDRIIYGHEGGMHGFVKESIDVTVEFLAAVPIANRVDEFMDGLSDDEYSVVASEYLAKYGHLLPDEIVSKRELYLPWILRQFLKQHPRLMLRMRNIH